MPKIVTVAVLDAAVALTGDALRIAPTLSPDRAAALGFGLGAPASSFNDTLAIGRPKSVTCPDQLPN